MAIHPYLAFAGNCREAFGRYKEIFGGELVLLTAADVPTEAGAPPVGANPDAVIHAALMSDIGLVMGADDPTGGFTGTVHGMCVSCSVADAAEATRLFDALADGGRIDMPLTKTFFSDAFAMCTDRYGIPWMINQAHPTDS